MPKRDFDPMGQGQAHDGIPSPFTATGQVKLSFLLFTLTSLPLRATNMQRSQECTVIFLFSDREMLETNPLAGRLSIRISLYGGVFWGGCQLTLFFLTRIASFDATLIVRVRKPEFEIPLFTWHAT